MSSLHRSTETNISHMPTIKQYLTFNTGGECYALGILLVKEIIEFGGITKIPMMPDFVRGVINLRGAVVPVIDLSARLYGKCVNESKRTCIVIVEIPDHVAGRTELGVVVDGVNEVLELNVTDLAAPPQFGSKVRTDFIEAMARLSDKLLMILAPDKVLSVEEMANLVAIAEPNLIREQ